MPQDEQAQSYLWDMREAAKEIVGFMSGIKFHEFEKNKMLRAAVERHLLVIGEAAVHISPQFRKQHPEIGWTRLVELRNILAHEYGETLLNRVWIAATQGIPELLAALKNLLPE
ncbi:MAG: HepT-like ribonuclease domain-containing protein [Chloroflexota bacterium]